MKTPPRITDAGNGRTGYLTKFTNYDELQAAVQDCCRRANSLPDVEWTYLKSYQPKSDVLLEGYLGFTTSGTVVKDPS